jgi:hypothetical protein
MQVTNEMLKKADKETKAMLEALLVQYGQEVLMQTQRFVRNLGKKPKRTSDMTLYFLTSASMWAVYDRRGSRMAWGLSAQLNLVRELLRNLGYELQFRRLKMPGQEPPAAMCFAEELGHDVLDVL